MGRGPFQHVYFLQVLLSILIRFSFRSTIQRNLDLIFVNSYMTDNTVQEKKRFYLSESSFEKGFFLVFTSC